MTITMTKYLMLEAEAFRLEEAGESANAVWDQMDPIWWALSDGEREELNRRIIGQVFTETIHLSADGVFIT
jgi:hypothetical protein